VARGLRVLFRGLPNPNMALGKSSSTVSHKTLNGWFIEKHLTAEDFPWKLVAKRNGS
jgi:hypothetical protein